jgi:sugar phosphate isomerase/epimerase
MTNRRDFFASCLSGMIVLPGLSDRLSLAPAAPETRHCTTRPWGIQLYTVREQARADLTGTLSTLAAMGYSEVEFAGLYDHGAAEVRAMLDGAQLTAPAGHVAMETLSDARIERTIEDAVTLGHRYLVVPSIDGDPRSVEGYAAAAETFNRAGRTVRAAGLTLGYHNHDADFASLDGATGGRCGYDILLQRTDPALVAMELDLFWIRKGGRDAFDYLRSETGRFRMVHIKDMDASGRMVDLGLGVMPWRELLDAAAAAGVTHWFAEHDEPADAMAFARSAVQYLRTLPG